ncbi:MAG: type III toxin-antitoxin system ToxN/AbiQ family toxin [Ruminiclostridium sp.]
MKDKLKLFNIDLKYVRDLSFVDDNVMSVSPQIGKSSRPFVGILLLVEGQKYCVPLSSPKPKFQNKKNAIDFVRILDETKHNEHSTPVIIGVLNFNNMIPVADDVVTEIDIKINKGDSPKTAKYKELLTKQLDWCRKNELNILSHANRLYSLVTKHPEKNRNLTRRCCDFKKLEAVLEKRQEKTLLHI